MSQLTDFCETLHENLFVEDILSSNVLIFHQLGILEWGPHKLLRWNDTDTSCVACRDILCDNILLGNEVLKAVQQECGCQSNYFFIFLVSLSQFINCEILCGAMW